MYLETTYKIAKIVCLSLVILLEETALKVAWPDPISYRDIIACSISTLHEKGLVSFA